MPPKYPPPHPGGHKLKRKTEIRTAGPLLNTIHTNTGGLTPTPRKLSLVSRNRQWAVLQQVSPCPYCLAVPRLDRSLSLRLARSHLARHGEVPLPQCVKRKASKQDQQSLCYPNLPPAAEASFLAPQVPSSQGAENSLYSCWGFAHAHVTCRAHPRRCLKELRSLHRLRKAIHHLVSGSLVLA